MSLIRKWLSHCGSLRVLGWFGLCFWLLQAGQAQSLSAQPQRLASPQRQTELRQVIRLGLQGEHEQVRARLAALRARAEQPEERGTLAALRSAETLSLVLQNKPLEALASYRQWPPLSSFEEDRAALAYVLSLRALLSYYRNDFKQVRADAERALTLLDPAHEAFETAFTLSALSLAQLAEQHVDEAEQTLQQSLRLCEQTNEALLAAFCYNNLGLVYQARDEHAKAQTAFHESLRRCQQNNGRTLQHYVLKNLGDACLRLNQTQPALNFYQQSLAERQTKGNSRELATIWANISDAHVALLQYAAAIQALETCRTIEMALGDQKAEAWRTFNIAVVYEIQENFRAALELLQKSLALAAARHDLKTQIHAATVIARLMIRQNNAALARDYLQKAERLAESAQEPTLSAYVWQMAAVFHQWRTEYHEALAVYAKLLQLPPTAWRNREKTSAWVGKAAVHISLGQFDEAEKALLAGQKGSGTAPMLYSLFDTAYWWSQLERARQRAAHALPHAQRAAAIADQLGRQDMRSMAYATLGNLLRQLQRPDEAYAALEQAIAAHEWLSTQTVGDASQQAFSFAPALSPYHEMLRLLIAQHKNAEALRFAERAKARTLLDVLQHGKDQLTRSLTTAEQSEEQRLEGVLRSLNLELTALRAQAQPAAGRLATLEKQLQQARLALEDFQTKLYAAHPQLRTQRGDLRLFDPSETAALAQGAATVCLEYVVTDEQTFLFVLTPDSPSVTVYEIPLRRAEVAARVTQWRQQLAARDPAFRGPARQLAEVLLGPARAQLRGQAQLVIVPDAALWELPFQALLLGERFLLEEHAVSYAPSLTALREMRRTREQRANQSATSLLAFGNPALPAATLTQTELIYRDYVLAPLPEAEREVKTLAQLYGTAHSKVFTGAQAREAFAKAEAGKHKFLHFATHGILNDASPLYSHLLLAQTDTVPGQDQTGLREDGLLEAREVLKLDLQAELVTLSACETARGNIGTGEGVIGLSWAFFVAGSPATLVSQWKVESSSTTKLMLNFYRQQQATAAATGPTPTKAAALRQAALALLQMPQYKHPFYWAAFVLIGDAR